MWKAWLQVRRWHKLWSRQSDKGLRIIRLNGEPPADTALEDLRALLDHLLIERAHVVGQSMGDWVVAGFALQYPDRTSSLTRANTYGGISTEAMRQWLAVIALDCAASDLLPIGRIV